MSFQYWIVAALAVGMPAASWAQPAPAGASATQATAPRVTLAYRSPWAERRPYVDEAVGDWRAANDLVGQIGGWRAYAREAQGAEPPRQGTAAPSPGASASSPQPMGAP